MRNSAPYLYFFDKHWTILLVNGEALNLNGLIESNTVQ